MKVFDYLNVLITELNESNSRNDKKKVLAKHPECRRILNYIYDPFKKFNITSKTCKKLEDKLNPNSTKKNKLSRFMNASKYEPLDISFFDFLDALISGKYSGHKAVSETLKWVNRWPEYEEIIYRIIDKDIKCRVGVKDINTIFEGLIPEFEIALADKYVDKNKKLPDENWRMSRKLDGCRLVTVLNGDVKFYSRSGKEFHTLDKIRQVLLPYKDLGIVLDGEICMMDDDGLDDFKAVMKEITRKNHQMRNPIYILIDLLKYDDFIRKESDELLDERHINANNFVQKIGNDRIQYLEQIPYTEKGFVEFREEAADKDWEGLILRKNCGYKGKRSRDILKVKDFFDGEFKVVGIKDTIIQVIREFEEPLPEGKTIMISNDEGIDLGTKNTKTVTRNVELPAMGSAIIMYKGSEVGVGSGWTEDQRIEFYEHPEKLIGNEITVKYKKESQDKDGNYSLQFPVVTAIHGKKRTV